MRQRFCFRFCQRLVQNGDCLLSSLSLIVKAGVSVRILPMVILKLRPRRKSGKGAHHPLSSIGCRAGTAISPQEFHAEQVPGREHRQ